MIPLKIVKVEWKDAKTSYGTPITLEEAKEEQLVEAETIGYLLKDDDEKVIIASFCFFDDDGEEMFLKTIHVIPKKTIKNIFELHIK